MIVLSNLSALADETVTKCDLVTDGSLSRTDFFREGSGSCRRAPSFTPVGLIG